MAFDRTSLLVTDRFFKGAAQLRSHFETRFTDPRQGSAERFVWDYWHVPSQYTLVRTPAQNFFPAPLFKAFLERLGAFGRERLGCVGVSPLWLSYYVDGCEQELHADVPHGPWAFVYSLTPWQKREFQGGETFLCQENLLEYWRRLSTLNGVESKDLIQTVEPEFNRLLVFDPRIPHGVRRVTGVRDPLKGRLVIHGWFTDPQPFVEGGLGPKSATRALQGLFARLDPILDEVEDDLHGTVCFEIRVTPAGRVSGARVLVHNLRTLEGEGLLVDPFLSQVQREVKTFVFPRATKPSRIVLPLLFRF